MDVVSMRNVFEVVKKERAYQKALWGPTEEGGEHSIAEFLVYIRDYTEEALHIQSRIAAPKCTEQSLHIVRKITALAFACMEQHGAPERIMQDLQNRCELHGVCPEVE